MGLLLMRKMRVIKILKILKIIPVNIVPLKLMYHLKHYREESLT